MSFPQFYSKICGVFYDNPAFAGFIPMSYFQENNFHVHVVFQIVLEPEIK